MKIAVISDTHGNVRNALDCLIDIGDLDYIIHLGDYVRDAIELKEELGMNVIYVRGNCDYSEDDVEEDKLVEIENKKIFITHGHKYSVKNDINRIFYKGKELYADVILFGHSHVSMLLEYDDTLIMNPGSPSNPRSGSKKSIGFIEIIDGEIKGEIITIN